MNPLHLNASRLRQALLVFGFVGFHSAVVQFLIAPVRLHIIFQAPGYLGTAEFVMGRLMEFVPNTIAYVLYGVLVFLAFPERRVRWAVLVSLTFTVYVSLIYLTKAWMTGKPVRWLFWLPEAILPLLVVPVTVCLCQASERAWRSGCR